jgi:hypothetical protein
MDNTALHPPVFETSHPGPDAQRGPRMKQLSLFGLTLVIAVAAFVGELAAAKGHAQVVTELVQAQADGSVSLW